MKTKSLVYFSAFVLSMAIAHGQTNLTTLTLSAGQRHALALRSDGSVWTWGTNQVGELGLGTNTLAMWPTRISNLSNIVSVSAGPFHSLAVQSNGTVWAWGTNNDGRLGNGNFLTASNPVPVSLITNAMIVAAGGNHSLAVLANGSVMAWGANYGGQLGTGNTVSTNKPVQAGSFTNVIAVAAGTNFSLALTQDGSVWAWGTNNYGQLGLGNTTSQLSPTKITTLSNIVQIAAGGSHCLALDNNGVVYAWGLNAQGQLGDGTTVNETAPEIVPTFGATTNLGAVKWIATGYNSSAAVLKSGRLFYWGWFGNGTAYSYTSQPNELNANSGLVFQNATYGDSYLLAGQSDGSTWAWGFNQYAQWGNGNIYATNDTWNYETVNAEFSFSASPYPQVTRFDCGDRYDMNPYAPFTYDVGYNTFVLPLDIEKGVRLINYGNDLYSYGASTPWFLKVQKIQRQHIWQLVSGTTNVTRFSVDNPVVAFGNDAGGSPLYLGQTYRFGVFAGAYDERTGQTNRFRILVYDRSVLASGATNVAPTNIITIALPRRSVAAEWSNYVANGNCVVIQTNGLRTMVQFREGQGWYGNWGLGFNYQTVPNVDMDGYILTETASSTNYCYILEGIGSAEVGANVFTPMGTTNTTGWAYLPLYAMSFDPFPPLLSHFIDNPHFMGTPMPPTYAGRSDMELNGLTAIITNNIWITNNPVYTNLDNSPELRRSPILDQFVSDMGNNPLALANYVINNIGLTDPMADENSSQLVAQSIEVGGVNRSAQATFLEGQGSPVEQCALLVYLLRQAGYPASYVWPTNSNMKLLASTVSRLWQINVSSVIYYSGIPVTTNGLIIVNYPWVVANIGTNTVQIFPWLKNTSIVEGQNIYNYTPTNYPDAYSFVKAYALANPTLMALGAPNDGINSIWKKWLTSLINTNQLQPNLSLDDFGVRAVNRPITSTAWSQLPVPDFMTNQSQVAVVDSLSDSPVTYPFLTNMFDRIRIQVFNNDTNTADQIFDTGLWRACDLHNRKLLLYTNTTSTVSLWLTAYRPGITAVTNFQNFDSGSNALDIQIAQTNIAGSVSNFQVLVTYQRRIATQANAYFWMPSEAFFSGTTPMTCSRRDVTAILPGVARVTQPMLQVYAEDYWRLEQQKAANTNFVPAVTDEAGDAAMILASTFFQKMWNDDQLNQQLHEVHGLTWFSQGTAALTPLSNGGMQVKLNMNWFVDYLIGNAGVEQGSGDWGNNAPINYMTMAQAEGSSAEHSVIASVWGDQSPVSTIRLMQIAAQNSISNGFAMPPELNIDNYTALGNQSYTGYGSTLLKNQIPSIWAAVTNVFATEWDSNFVRVLITPGQVTNATGSFVGMSALIFGNTQSGAIMSQDQTTLNGGWSDDIFWVGDYDYYPTYDLTYNLDYSPSIGYTFTYNSLTTPQPQFYFSPYSALTANTGGSGQTAQIAYTPQQLTQASLFSYGLNLPFTSTPSAIQAEKNTGWFGRPWAGIKQLGAVAAEPVQVVSGDFYADDVDMTLAGPMPLQLRRNYTSHDVADGELGTGWKLSFTPRLVLTTNASNNPLIYAAEPDGAVLAYRYQSNNLWTVMAADNPDLVNFTSSGIGAKANLFNNTIQQNLTNSGIYTLFGSDGSQRTYQTMTTFAITSGTNQLSRIRPYLTRWQDHAGNYYTFAYGTNPTNDDFGQLYRVQGANGASLTFKYDFYGRIIQAISDDDRIVNYQYDNYGDLVLVTLPDNSQWQYGYDHYTFTTNSQTYTDSDHLLVSETKPNGRQVVNTYDNLRRVIMQQATVGMNRQLITNAWFYYTNNCTSLTNDYISGLTRLDDVFHNSYFYYYTNNLVTLIQKPLGLATVQTWFADSQSNQAGYYPRSLQYTVDIRGLTNAFLYNPNGNITNQTIYGDLTGNGVGGQSATNTYTYTTNNCPATAIDPSGNQLSFLYNDPSDAYHLTDLQFSSGGIGVATNHWLYTNVTTVVNMGGWFQTNTSYGLCYQEILADSATNAWIYNGRGFPVQLTRYAATADLPNDSDPPVVTYLSFTPRGDLATATAADGHQVSMNYDDMGRLQWRDVFDQSGNVVSRENFYYNQNGDLEWYDGPRSNPDDYIYFSYDGAGREVQEIRWRTQAKPDGTGIQAVSGDNLYATTFFAYDFFGNLMSVTDQRGAFTTNSWDALGRLVQRQSFDVGGSTQLAAEGFSYEPGGLVQSYTNALGGVTTIRYTSTGQPEFRQNADGSTNGWTYYLDGRVQNEIQGNGAFWQTTYNDANRIVTHIFYSAAGVPLATNVMDFDRRGNPVQWTDAAGNTFVKFFDGLGRVKSIAGPSIVTVTESSGGGIGFPGTNITYVTNVTQQAFTNFFDAAGMAVTNVNTLGETTVTTLDALGRITSTLIYSASSSLVRERYFTYAADHNSVTVTDGSGATAISHTIYTDSDGNPVLSVAYPSPNTTEFTLNQFDVAGNLVSAQHDSSANGAVTTWATASYSFDGLNRLTRKIDRDNALTTYAYDSMGDLINRAMPGGLQWNASYNNAGQILQDWLVGSDGSGTRTNVYIYYPGSSPFVGLLENKIDGRGITNDYFYNDRLRVATNSTEYDPNGVYVVSTAWQYDSRGLLTNVTELYPRDDTGSHPRVVSRAYDAYGQLNSETVTLDGATLTSASQVWDAAGRRTGLSINGVNYSFASRADGALTYASDPTGNGIYTFDTAGLLTSRVVGQKANYVTSRDGEGRPYGVATDIGGLRQLTETLSYAGDGLLASDTLTRSDFTDSRSYSYAPLSRRLTREQLNLNTTTGWTNNFVYDDGMSAGLGVLTMAGASASGSAKWSGGADAFSRISNETNTTIVREAYGRLNGQATVSALLDGEPLSVTTNAAQDPSWSLQWRSFMELTPGAHQLKVSALHPSGFYTAYATNWFTNNATGDVTADAYNNEGLLESRTCTDTNGVLKHQLYLDWDGRDRIDDAYEVDGNYNGYWLIAKYDGLNRRLISQYYAMTNGIAYIAAPIGYLAIQQYYDPQVEYLELGANVNNNPYGGDGQTTWKLYGPDLDGNYGGENGTGGFDAVSPYLNQFNPAISDSHGNILGEVTNGIVSWNPSRPTGYGAVPGYQPASFGHGADMAQSSAWRGRWPDLSGLVYLGARYYDPQSGRFMSADPVWNENDPDYYTFCGGDPINYFDPDGRFGKAAWNRIAGDVSQSLMDSAAQDRYDNAMQMVGWSSIFGNKQMKQEFQQIANENRKYLNERQAQFNTDVHATYVYYGNSALLTANAYFNPLVNVELSGSEMSSGMGLHYQNSGQSLTVEQRINASADFTIGSVQTIGLATGVTKLGFGSLSSATSRMLDESLPSQFNIAGSQGAGTLPRMGTVYVKPPLGATAAQIQQVQAYVNGANQAIAQGLLMEGRVSTAGALREAASDAAQNERAAAAAMGRPYQGQVGHVPDTTWLGTAQPFMWLDLDPRVNMSIGGQANGYPIGFVPTDFQLKY